MTTAIQAEQGGNPRHVAELHVAERGRFIVTCSICDLRVICHSFDAAYWWTLRHYVHPDERDEDIDTSKREENQPTFRPRGRSVTKTRITDKTKGEA